jgi:hypothetical protein
MKYDRKRKENETYIHKEKRAINCPGLLLEF